MLAGAALGHQPVPTARRNASLSRVLMNERALAGRSSRSSAWGESAYVADTDDSELRGLWDVIRYAQYLNPKEFDLPKDLLPGIKLPGSYKTASERKAKSIIDLENGQIPRPIRRCFVCARTCLFAPLLPCDFCSSCFHLDCLDPPLPHFPSRSDRWMCPNHVEHVVDRYLVRSIRLTERMRIWAQLASSGTNDSTDAPVDSHATSHTPVSAESGEVSAKSSLSESQANAPANQCTASVTERPTTPPLPIVAPYELSYGPDDEATILADLMHRVQRGRAELSSLVASANTAQETVGDRARVITSGTARDCWRLNSSPTCQILRDQKRKLKIVVPRAIKWLYVNRVKKIPTNLSHVEPPRETEPSNEADQKLVGSVTSPAKVCKHDAVMNENLCEQSPIQIRLKQVDADLIERNLPNPASQIVHGRNGLRFWGSGSRAVLSPCGVTTGPLVKMHFRTLTVGTSSDCHLCLSNYRVPNPTPCACVSTHHATIFYDDWTRHFELLNYSEFGTEVDGIRYGNMIDSRGLRSQEGSPNRKLSTLEKPQHTCVHATQHSVSSLSAGWEGSAILRHGSLLQFGCYQFVLGLVDHTIMDPSAVDPDTLENNATVGSSSSSSPNSSPS
ncbi:unnamed protein product [Echinostoma caproni]|uniref:FHA domain-containing protein n=1 Tax=Echinostoma caproni TaxID=27848 RepID=A0A183AH32_9TREM|nr:unnamed protein product [Echinostoma caproni]